MHLSSISRALAVASGLISATAFFPNFFAATAALRSASRCMRSLKACLDFLPWTTKPTIPSTLFLNPSKKERTEKKRDAFLLFAIDGRTQTSKLPPPSTYAGTRETQVLTHSPLTQTWQVPHSPFPHLYLMYCPACAATSFRGSPGFAMVSSVSSPWEKTTGIEPVRPTAAPPFSAAPPSVSARVFRRSQTFIVGAPKRSG